jgi:hypothetical protein
MEIQVDSVKPGNEKPGLDASHIATETGIFNRHPQ